MGEKKETWRSIAGLLYQHTVNVDRVYNESGRRRRDQGLIVLRDGGQEQAFVDLHIVLPPVVDLAERHLAVATATSEG